MLDIKYIRDNADKVQKAADDKFLDINIEELLKVDKERVALMQKIE
ncbi:MAG TPA: serine--tRNA ligase, partial [Candidatus Pacebacteria bacterium]|nr:serine--tRNA ligase [Candidatus Paceibacterota bacterium]